MYPDSIRTIALVAPSGPLSREKAEPGIALLERSGKTVKPMAHLWQGHDLPYLAASAEERAEDLTAAWLDPDVDLVLCLRGGFGAAHLLPLLDWELLASRNVPVAGYSDITALHFAMERFGAGTALAAPMLGKLSVLAEDVYTQRELCAACDSKSPRRIADVPGAALTVLKPGRVKARPLAGNLAVAASLCGSPYQPDCRGRLVILEDLNEAPYRIDRYLTQLVLSGFFDGCAGIALGGFLDCGSEETLKLIFGRLTSVTEGPVVMNFPFSHGFPFASLNFAQEIILETP